MEDDTPDRELRGLERIEFRPDGSSRWIYRDSKRLGMARIEFKPGQIAYIQLGVD